MGSAVECGRRVYVDMSAEEPYSGLVGQSVRDRQNLGDIDIEGVRVRSGHDRLLSVSRSGRPGGPTPPAPSQRKHTGWAVRGGYHGGSPAGAHSKRHERDQATLSAQHLSGVVE